MAHGGWNPFAHEVQHNPPALGTGRCCFDLFRGSSSPSLNVVSELLSGVLARRIPGGRIRLCASPGGREFETTIAPVEVCETQGALMTCVEFNGQQQGAMTKGHPKTSPLSEEKTSLPQQLDNAEGDASTRHAGSGNTGDECFRRTFANASVGFAITGTDGTIHHINEHYCRIIGCSREEIVGRSFAEITHPDDVARKLELNQDLVAGRIDHFVVEKRYVRGGGDIAWVENSVSVIRDEEGVSLNLLVLCKDITAARRDREQRRLLEACVANLHDMVIVTEAKPISEPGPRIVFANSSFTSHTGYLQREVLGRSPRFLQGPETDRDALSRIRAAVSEGRPIREELVNYKKDGTPFCVEIDMVPISAPGEAPSHFVAVQRDITQRRKTEDLMLSSNLRYEKQRQALTALMQRGVFQAQSLEDARRGITRIVADAVQVERVSIWRFTPDRDAIVCQELFELTPQRHSSGPELNSRSYPDYFRALQEDDLVSADDALHDPRTREFADSYLKPLQITSMLDSRIHGVDGLEGVLCLEHVGPLRAWTRDERSFAVSVANLISLALAHWERREIMEQLRQQASLLDKAQDAILVRDLDSTITYWNKSAQHLYGWSADEAVGRRASQLLYADPSRFEEVTALVLAKGEWQGEIEQVSKSGGEVVVEGRWTLVRGTAGQPKSILAINTNITEKKKLEDQIYRAQRLENIGALAGGMAHDLNNILTPIMMSIDLLKLRIKDPSCHETLGMIASNAHRGADMVSQVLSFARGGVTARKRPVEMGSLLRDLAGIIRDTFPKNIQFRLRDCGMKWTVVGDSTQIHQVLLNLCVNARDAMPAGGSLTVRAENVMIDAQYAAMNLEAGEGPHVMLCVEDDGLGISREIIHRIFDPFFTTKDPGKGTGLGLSTSLAIIRDHGGFIRVYSEPGRGTRCNVYFPALSETVVETPPSGERSMRQGSSELVLVVDDEMSVREITRQTLEAWGYRVLLASDGAEAVTLYAAHQKEIAVILTDMMMPVMDGSSTIQVLIKMNPEIRIIAASGITTNDSLARTAGNGNTRFLSKPYTAQTLLRTLEEILSKDTV